MFMPVLSFLLFEWVTGNLFHLSRPFLVLGILWTAVFYLAAFGIFGNTRFSLPLVSLFFYSLSVAETFVMEFRQNPIMLWDIFSLPTALSVAQNYHFSFSMEMKTAGMVLLNINYLFLFFPLRARGLKQRLAAGIGSFGLLAAYVSVFFRQIVPAWALVINMWAMQESFDTYGYILATAVSAQYLVKKPPRGYSHAHLQELAEKIENGTYFAGESISENKGIRPVNLICIMNESLADLRVAGEFTTNKDYFPFLHGLTENTVKGSLCVPVFGAMTSNTEFEFLTGDSMALFPVNTTAYQFYVRPDTKSLVSTLKAQGYRAVAMHPYPPENWNRDKCYASMGFDAFLSWDDFLGSEVLRYYVSDRGNYQKIIEEVEKKESPSDKLFIFNVTMQNHGGYDEVNESFPHEIYLTGENRGKFPKTDQYLSLMLESDRAFQELTEYFSRVDEPTMLVMFGDHQPGIEEEFYNHIAGRPSGEIPDEEHLIWYQTPLVIWTNYSQPSQDLGKLGAVYLSSYVLERANLSMSPFQRFLGRMSKKLPVIHPIGCYGQDGAYYTWEEARSASCPFSTLVQDYEGMVYNHSLDVQKAEALFSLPQ
ncbi:MAG: LTA synthase family protein [Lachnospiraceae bacterium]|nr:LTA synthase family protein [Lachnospiraceae bacterium]